MITLASTYILEESLYGVSLHGAAMPQLARALTLALSQYLPTLTVQTAVVGISGTGTGIGAWTLNPTIGAVMLAENMAAAGALGSAIPALAQGMASGIFTQISTSVITSSVVVGVGSGTEAGAVIGANPATFAAILHDAMVGQGLLGSFVPALSQGVAQGLTTWFASGVVNGVVTGAIIPPFGVATGTGIGSLV